MPANTNLVKIVQIFVQKIQLFYKKVQMLLKIDTYLYCWYNYFFQLKSNKMDIKQISAGTIAGAITTFLLGFLMI